MNLHTSVCFVLDVVHHFKQQNSWGRTKMERKAEERQGCKYFNASCVTFFTFETDAAGKYPSPKKSTEGFPFNHAICVYKYLNRSMAILKMTVRPILIVTIYLF